MDTTRIAYGAAPRPASGVSPASRPAVSQASTTSGAKPAAVAAAAATAPADKPAVPEQAPPQASTRPQREEIMKALEDIGSHIDRESRALNFEINEEIDGVVVSVIDAETEELVRQIPAEVVVRVAAALREYSGPAGSASGWLLEEQA